MSRMSLRAPLIIGLLLLLLAFAPLSAISFGHQEEASAEQQVAVDSVDPLAVYLVDVMNHIQQFHPDGGDLTRQDMIEGARDAVIVEIRRNAELPAGQRDELLEWLDDRPFNSATHLMYVLNEFSKFYTELDMVGMADAAAHGVVGATGDPFSRVMSMEEMQQMQEQMMSPEDRSLGINPAPIPTEDDTLRIEVAHVRRGYVGFEMGLEKGDEILEVNGVRVKDMPRGGVGQYLQADVGDEVRIVIKRDGFDEPIALHGVQRTLSRPAARSRMLPGDIGYISTNMFSMDFGTVVRNEVENFERRGAVGLILDLRNNPGGAMNACTQIADDFLPEGEVITYTKGTYQPPAMMRMLQQLVAPDGGERVDDETTVYRAANPQRFDLPLVVLVNEMSASASEMLSGAFKSHERAVIVGETTFGKGVGQTGVPLSTTPSGEGGGLGGMFGGDMRMLFMTVMSYYGPDGEVVHEVGVEPNVVVPEAKPDAKVFDRVAELRASGAIEEYVTENLTNHRRFFRTQLVGTPATLDEFPNIASLRNHPAAEGFSDETLAREIRRAAKSHLNLNANLVDDNQMQVAILEVAKLANLELEGIDEFRHFAD